MQNTSGSRKFAGDFDVRSSKMERHAWTGKRPGRLSGLERFERWTETLQMAGTRTGALAATRRMWRHGARGLRRTASARRRGALAYLAVIGPGMVAACAGNDAG